jgi:hypothetical protein
MGPSENALEIGPADVKLVMNVRGSLIVRDGEPALQSCPVDPSRLFLEEMTS